jgi:hypothetical protein
MTVFWVVASISEISVNVYQTTPHNSPEESVILLLAILRPSNLTGLKPSNRVGALISPL